MGILKWTKKIDPQKAIETLASGIDNVFYTKEEKAEAAKKAFDQWLEFYKLVNDENTARSITRRYLAIMFAAVFLFLVLAASICWAFNQQYANFLIDITKMISPYVGGIMLFYFGYYGVKSVIQSVNKT